MESEKVVRKEDEEKSIDHNNLILSFEEPDDQGMYTINANQLIVNEASSPVSSRSPFNKDEIPPINEREELLTIELEVEEGKEANIIVYKGEKSDEVTDRICKQFNINSEIKESLKATIGQKIKATENSLIQSIKNQSFETFNNFKNNENNKQNKTFPDMRRSYNVERKEKDVINRKRHNPASYSNNNHNNLNSLIPKKSFKQNKIVFPQQKEAIVNEENLIIRETDENVKYNYNPNSMVRLSEDKRWQCVARGKSTANYKGDVVYRLHNEAIMKKICKEQKNKILNKMKVEREIEEFTFQPEINAISKLICKKPNQKLEDYLLLEGAKILGRKNDLKTKLLNEEKMKMSFKPIISEKSKLIVSKANQGRTIEYEDNLFQKDTFSQLYEDAIKRKKQKDKISQEYSGNKKSNNKNLKEFPSKPIKKFSPYRVQPKLFPNHFLNFKKNEENFEPAFKPQICNRTKSINRNKNNLPIGEYLYQNHQLINEKLEKASKEQEIKIEENLNKSFAQKKSLQIIEKMKIDSFIHIFNKLDHKSMGKISPKSINSNSNLIRSK